MFKHTLGTDLETFSSVSLAKCGVHRYVEAPDFEILLFSYSIDKATPVCIDLAAGDEIPEHIVEMLYDDTVLKTAHNAPFEINCLNKYLDKPLIISQWSCTAVLASQLGLPFGLDKLGEILHTPTQKDKEGKALLRFFTVPRNPTKNNFTTRNQWYDFPLKWVAFKSYNKTDVSAEQQVRTLLLSYHVDLIDQEKELWVIDQNINNRGVKADLPFIKNALTIFNRYKAELLRESSDITKLNNTNSPAQLTRWISEKLGRTVTSIDKEALPVLIKEATDADVKRVLIIRREVSRTSIQKYNTIIKGHNIDHVCRGLFQFGGARTQRWAGRRTQLQNLPKHYIKDSDLDLARSLVMDGNYDMLCMLYGDVINILKQLIRTSFIPRKKENSLLIGDFTAIEALITAYLAREEWRMKVFKTHGKIYEASAARMYNIAIEKVTGIQRQKGKLAELALGYQGAVNAMIRIGADKFMTVEEMEALVELWRKMNPSIVRLWYKLDELVIQAFRTKQIVRYRGLAFLPDEDVFRISLPSGRCINYFKPQVKEVKMYSEKKKKHYTKFVFSYMGMNQVTRKWKRQTTYGGKLLENIVQSWARDLLADKMHKTEAAGLPIAIHVHDELVLDEAPKHFDKFHAIMNEPVAWCKDLPLKAKTFMSNYYKKD